MAAEAFVSIINGLQEGKTETNIRKFSNNPSAEGILPDIKFEGPWEKDLFVREFPPRPDLLSVVG